MRVDGYPFSVKSSLLEQHHGGTRSITNPMHTAQKVISLCKLRYHHVRANPDLVISIKYPHMKATEISYSCKAVLYQNKKRSRALVIFTRLVRADY